MFKFSSVKSKLFFISLLTVLGFSVLTLLSIYYANSQEQFLKIRSHSKVLQISIINLNHISKEQTIDKSFFQQFSRVEKNFETLQKSMDTLKFNTNLLKKLHAQLNSAKKSYDTVFQKQKQIHQHLENMHQSKQMIKNIFEKVYDYKLIQYMMKLELDEFNYLLNGLIDLDEFNKTHFKMRRSVRGSENFTTNKPLQKKINGALIEYKKMLIYVIQGQKEIKLLKQNLNNSLKKTLAILKQTNQNTLENINTSNNKLLYTIIFISLLIVLLQFTIITLFSKNIIQNLNQMHKGINEFFSYLEHKTDNFKPIQTTSKDEIGYISKEINKHAKQAQDSLIQDKKLLEDVKIVLTRVSNGWFSQHIKESSLNPMLNEIKSLINTMLLHQNDRFTTINKLLGEYGNQDYRKKLELHGIEKGGIFEKLMNEINNLQETITHILIENKSNGMTLDNSSDILLINVNILNQNSNEAAASLEETATAIEQITTNIQGNTKNVIEMSKYASDVTNSAYTGETLAQQTTHSMDEINNEVTAIHEAITIIDQIAFQTNILSLNAAVEAATAGEAGKGFAVVAQEVRNLATRSAEAASEIKALVENAKNKAHEGKNIAVQMIVGYKELNQNISYTIELIKDVERVSKEQQSGILQINDAINSLDKKTQQNANIATQTHKIAVETDTIAKLVVSNANEKEFIGKNNVQAKNTKEDLTRL